MTKASCIEKHRQAVSRNKDEFIKRRDRLRRDPFIDSYEKELAALFRDCASGKFGSDEFEEKSRAVEEKRKARLVALGEKEDAMTYRPLCGICDDTGYINGKVCRCLEQMIIDDMYSESGIAEMLRKENFDTYDLNIFSDKTADGQKTSPRKNAENLRDAMMAFVRNFSRTDASLMFSGPTATGKTFLAHCIARELIEMGKTVIYTTSFNMCDKLVDNQFGRLEDDAVNKFFECDFLIIDELGQESNTEPARNQLYNVINERLNRSKKTLITTNYSLSRLEVIYEERLVSRLSLYRRFLFFGDDLRINRKTLGKVLKEKK